MIFLTPLLDNAESFANSAPTRTIAGDDEVMRVGLAVLCGLDRDHVDANLRRMFPGTSCGNDIYYSSWLTMY